jgi:RNA polymerase sigma factor (sigma-70 family)
VAALTSNEALSYLRRRGRRETSTDPEVLEAMADERQCAKTNDPREALDAAQRRRLIEKAMADLSPQQRAVFALRLREDMGPKEIAERLGLPAHQVRTQLHRAIAALREALSEKRG